MEPFESDQLSDQELDAVMAEWKTPPAPERLRAAVFPVPPRRWYSFLWMSIRVPLPVAACLAVMAAAAVWRLSLPAPIREVIRTERVEVPVVKERVVTVYRDRIVRAPVSELQPVAELRPRIIRRGDVQN